MTTEATTARIPNVSDRALAHAVGLCVRECSLTWELVNGDRVSVVTLEGGQKLTAATNPLLIASLLDRLTDALEQIESLAKDEAFELAEATIETVGKASAKS